MCAQKKLELQNLQNLQIFKLIRQARTQVTITKVEIVVEDLRKENIHEPSADLKLGFQASIKAFSRAIKY